MHVEIPGQGKVIGFYGREAQMIVHCEEFAELIQAVSKMYRYGCGPDIPPDAYENLVEEMADSLVCMEQLMEMFDVPEHELQRMIDYKCARQEARMDDAG